MAITRSHPRENEENRPDRAPVSLRPETSGNQPRRNSNTGPGRRNPGRNNGEEEVNQSHPHFTQHPAFLEAVQEAVLNVLAGQRDRDRTPEMQAPRITEGDRRAASLVQVSEELTRIDRAARAQNPLPPPLRDHPAQPGVSRAMQERLGARSPSIQTRLGSHPRAPAPSLPQRGNKSSRAPMAPAVTERPQGSIRDRLGPRRPAHSHQHSGRVSLADLGRSGHGGNDLGYQEGRGAERGDVQGEVQSRLNLNEIALQVAKINRGEDAPNRHQEGPASGLAPNPFCRRIQSVLLPAGQEIPRSMADYNGTGCPDEHRRQFESRMTLHGFSEDMLARLFAMSLRGHASTWFYQLSPCSVSSYQHLIEQFISYFRTNKRTALSSSSLFRIQQLEDEPLRDYWQRFNREALKVNDLTLERRKEVLFETLRSEKVKQAIILDCGDTLENLTRVVEAHCKVEEMRLFSKAGRESSRPGNRDKGRERESNARTNKDRELRNRKDNYENPFKHPVKAVYAMIKGQSFVPPPKRFHETEATRRSSHFCDFHEQRGHATNDCFDLRKLLNMLLNSGYLKEYLRNSGVTATRERSRTPPRRAAPREVPQHRTHDGTAKAGGFPPPPPRSDRPQTDSYYQDQDDDTMGVVQVISGGYVGGDSRNAREKINKILQKPPTPPARVYAVGRVEGAQEAVSFSDTDLPFDYDFGEIEPDFPLVVTLRMANKQVKRVLIDTGSSVNIMTTNALNQLGIQKYQVHECKTSLVGFNGSPLRPLGVVKLATTMGRGQTAKTIECSYVVVDIHLEYNIIFGRTGLNAFDAIPSTKHLKLKWPTKYGVGMLSGNLQDAWRCYQEAVNTATQGLRSKPSTPVRPQVKLNRPVPEILLPGDPSLVFTNGDSVPDVLKSKHSGLAPPRMEPQSYKEIPVSTTDPTRTVRVGSDLAPQAEVQLVAFLQARAGTFAWSTDDLVGISPQIAEHRLNVDPNAKPVRQKRRIHSDEKNKAITTEVHRLLEAGHIRELFYADWLCNVVMVTKKMEGGEKKWRMCVDFTDLNRHCPKDCYPLPSIDQLVDSTAGCELLSMMDASQGYYQVPMAEDDRPKTAFITNDGVFGFNVMPFGLKNAGATYQRLVNRMFAAQIGSTMEVYVDDMLVKSLKAENHLAHLTECFNILDKYRMKLNPKKCTFGVKGGTFLGYVVNERGIEANPEKIKAILELPSPVTLKQVQQLVGKLIALNRFISHSAEKNLPFFKTFRRNKIFEWTEGCENAFQAVKSYLQTPPLLAKTVPGEALLLYLAVARETISAVLLRSEGAMQLPVYYLSRVLTPAETNYPEVEKAALCVVNCARKLRHYFQAHKIIVLTNYPLRQALTNVLTAGRMVKWAVELGEHEIVYHPRTAVKAQALADFLIPQEKGEPTPTPVINSVPIPSWLPEDAILSVTGVPPWLVHVDGSSNGSEAGVGITIRSPEGVIVEYAIHLNFRATNNEAEYEAAIIGLRMALELKATRVCLFTDSDLVKKQISGEYQIHEISLAEYNSKLKELIAKFEDCAVDHLVRTNNERADALSKFAIRTPESRTRTITLSTSSEPSIKMELLKRFSVLSVNVSEPWIASMSQYLQHGTLPPDDKAARNVKFRSARYQLDDGILYKRGYNGVLLRCLEKGEADLVLREVHEGHCGNHSGYRSLVSKVLRTGYYWITMVSDCHLYTQKCEKCQRFAHYGHCPSRPAKQMTACCPFDTWGIDIIGPFPMSTGQRKYVLLMVDHFSKWVEAEAMATITSSKVVKFMWKFVICRYGIPRILISDNGTQFESAEFKNWCLELKIRQRFTSVGHPQSNGLTEATNKTITEGIKKRLDKAKGSWADVLDGVLWSYRTTPHTATKETPFSLVYGSEALIPAEIAVETLRVAQYAQDGNKEARILDLDILECKRDLVRVRTQRYKATLQRKLDKHLRPRTIQVGDLVLKRVEASKNLGKLNEPWEGPYKVRSASMGGHSFKLEFMSGEEVPRTWNIQDLRKFLC